jgi:hypothetical protein
MALAAISITEQFWSSASMVIVPLGLLIRCKPRGLPGVSPLASKTVALRRSVLSVMAIGGTPPSARRVGETHQFSIAHNQIFGGFHPPFESSLEFRPAF